MSVQDKEWSVENNSSAAQQDERQYHQSMRPHTNGYMPSYVQDHPHAMYVTIFFTFAFSPERSFMLRFTSRLN